MDRVVVEFILNIFEVCETSAYSAIFLLIFDPRKISGTSLPLFYVRTLNCPCATSGYVLHYVSDLTADAFWHAHMASFVPEVKSAVLIEKFGPHELGKFWKWYREPQVAH